VTDVVHHSPSALDRLPVGALGVPELDGDPAWRLAAAFLVGFRGHTRRAYFNDIRAWYAWCADVGVSPLDAQRHHVDRWIAEQTDRPQAATGKPAAPSTVSRRLSCLSGLYEYAVVDAGLIESSPVVRVKRPKVSDHSGTVGLDEKELIALLGAAEDDGLRSAALITLLALNGLRIGEALALDVADLTYDFGHRVLNLVRKGNKRSTEALAPATARVLAAYIDERTSGPISLTTRTSASPSQLPGVWCAALPNERVCLPLTGSARTACGIAPLQLLSTPACRSETCRTSPATPIPVPPDVTTALGTALIAMPPTCWRLTCDVMTA